MYTTIFRIYWLHISQKILGYIQQHATSGDLSYRVIIDIAHIISVAKLVMHMQM